MAAPGRRPSQDYTVVSLPSSSSASHTASHDPRASISTSRTHIRRRTVGLESSSEVIIPLSGEAVDDKDEYFSTREKRTGSAYSKLSLAGEADEEDGLLSTGGAGSSGWQDVGTMRLAVESVKRKRVIKRCLTAAAVVAVGGLCWYGGWETRNAAGARKVGTGGRTMISHVSTSEVCNPYEQVRSFLLSAPLLCPDSFVALVY
jgi:hypothetical protein